MWIPNSVLDDRDLTPTQRATYIALLYYKEKGIDSPSITQLSKIASIKSRNTICDSIKYLEEVGYLTRKVVYGSHTTYTLNERRQHHD